MHLFSLHIFYQCKQNLICSFKKLQKYIYKYMYIFDFLLFSNLPELIHTKFVPVALPDIYQKLLSTHTFLCVFRLKQNIFFWFMLIFFVLVITLQKLQKCHKIVSDHEMPAAACVSSGENFFFPLTQRFYGLIGVAHPKPSSKSSFNHLGSRSSVVLAWVESTRRPLLKVSYKKNLTIVFIHFLPHL